jgi:two-component system response regulator FlrC
MAHVLVVDDESAVRSYLVAVLEDDGHVVLQAGDGLEALARLAEQSVHVVLSDLRMPRMEGLELLKAVRREYPEVEVVMLTGHASVESAVEAMKAGAFDFVEKPLRSADELRLIVDRAVERHRLKAAHEMAVKEADPPLGYGSPAMVTVERALQKVAPTEATVLLLGESGSGKEVAARAVHGWSARAHGPFVAVNCATLSATLLESELFGHEKGAFTGAHARQRGRIELAESGSFFLDEVGELAPGLQARLLRVLQEKRFERVGGRQSVEANVRWIAATNRDLAAMVRRGDFREDLYHRLAVFPVRLPPLRERREDIGPLAERLLGGIGASLGRPALRLRPEARQALALRDWPGNVRELANVLERTAILVEGEEIGVENLALLQAVEGAGAAPAPVVVAAEASERAVPEPVDAADSGAVALPDVAADERTRILTALERCAGNQTRAARLLGMSRGTLVSRLTEYDLPRPRKRFPR